MGVSEDEVLVQYWDWRLRSEESGDFIAKRLDIEWCRHRRFDSEETGDFIVKRLEIQW